MNRPPEHAPGDNPNIYWIVYTCSNCGKDDYEGIEKGKLAPYEWTSTPCPYCKCFTLYKAKL
jgi:hypothetical protein